MPDHERAILPIDLHGRLVRAVLDRYPRKSFGYLVTDEVTSRPVDFVLFQENIRNHPDWRGEFVSRGRYFAAHPDAGFVATPQESWRVQMLLRRRGWREVAVFHTHRRHPGSLSGIDFDLHLGRFGSLRHLIISLRNPRQPQLRMFAVSGAGVRELRLTLTPARSYPHPGGGLSSTTGS